MSNVQTMGNTPLVWKDRSYGKSRGKGWGKNSYDDYSTFGELVWEKEQVYHVK